MTQIIDEGLLACDDCTMAIANDNYSGLDYHYSEPESTERMETIQAALAAYAERGLYPVVGEEYGFSWKSCDCCGFRLGGNRSYFALLGSEVTQ